ncbi:MAG: hypothetical protein NC320_04820 [Clostridium sp.]|nr:hypothetical protein [Clostridium sp.]MCM1548250.1 hypothetical protein [Ruminococcus sp.]
MKITRKTIAVFSALSIIFVCGCEKNNASPNSIVYYDNDAPYSQSAEKIEANDSDNFSEKEYEISFPTVPANINEPAEVSGISVNLTNVYDVGILEKSIIYDTQKQVLAFVFEITNNSDTDIEVNSLNLSLNILDGETTNIIPDVFGMNHSQKQISDIKLLDGIVKPGETVKGFSPISIDPKWNSCSVYYNNSALENTAVSFDITKDMVEAAP